MNYLGDGQVVKIFEAEAGSGTVSEPVNRAYYFQHALQFISDGAGTLLVEHSIDKENWVTLDATMDPNTIVVYDHHIQWLRVTKAANADEVNVLIAGTAQYDS